MSDQHLKYIKDLVDGVSSSFCAAKWYNASIWLGNGRTASCHHPLAHHVKTSEILKDPSALHNTSEKKLARKQMLKGERPQECGYCWRVEDLKNEKIYSDRVFKSMVYTPADIIELVDIDAEEHVDPKNLEICFDSLCNLECSYCNPEFSTTWGTDIEKNGPYTNMKTNGGHTYENDGQNGMPFGSKNTGNFYIKAFFKWYEESLRKNLQELRISGGEPSRSPDFWKLVAMFNKEKFAFAVNSNLIMDEDRLTRLADIKDNFKKYDIYTSCEAVGSNAEFARANLDYEFWKSNCIKLQQMQPGIGTHIMMTVSVLTVWTMDKFLDDVVEMRKQLQEELGTSVNYYHMSVNILRYPSFQSVNILPLAIKTDLADRLVDSVERNKRHMSDLEINNYERCIDYLRLVDVSYEDTDSSEDKINDFVKFITQYSERKSMSLSMMPDEFNDWFNQLKRALDE